MYRIHIRRRDDGMFGGHVTSDLLNEIQRAGNIGIDQVMDRIEVLVEESLPEPMPCVGQQGIDRAAVRRRIQAIDPFRRCQIGFDCVDLDAEFAELRGRCFDRLIGSDQQIATILCAALRQLVSDIARRAGHDRKTRRLVRVLLFFFGCLVMIQLPG